MFLTFYNESKIGFKNRKENYFFYFLSSNQKTSLTNILNFKRLDKLTQPN